jgi:hypothetical protein
VRRTWCLQLVDVVRAPLADLMYFVVGAFEAIAGFSRP